MRTLTALSSAAAWVATAIAPLLVAQPYTFRVIEQFQPNAINSKEVVVGQGGIPVQGFYRFEGFITNVNDPSMPCSQTTLTGVNTIGAIVGFTESCTGQIGRGFLLLNGIFRTISVPGATLTQPSSINDLGDIAGSYSIGANNFGFVLDGNNFQQLPNPVAGINNRGDVVGSLPNGTGYLIRNGVTVPIVVPGLGGISVTGINDEGNIAGYGNTQGFVIRHGAVTKFSFPANASFTRVNGINNNNQITGFSIGPDGLTAFIGTPVEGEAE